jgi:hypothetical protein
VSDSGRERAKDALAVLLLSAAVALAFSEALAPGRGLYFRDHAQVFRPIWTAVRAAMLRGELPQVTRFSQGGVPLEQSMAAFTYGPTTLLFLLGEVPAVYDLAVAAQFAILAAGAFFLARALSASRAEAVLAASVASLAGPTVSFENLFGALTSIAWAPWVFLAFLRILRSPSLANGALFAFAAAFHEQAILPTFAVGDLVAFALLFAAERRRVRIGRAQVLVLGLGMALAVLLSAPDLFPMLSVLSASRRGQGFGAGELNAWSLRPGQLLELIAPGLWGPEELPTAVVGPLIGAPLGESPYLSSLYFGPALALVAAGAAAAFGDRHRLPAVTSPARRAVVAAAVFAFLMALGSATPLHGLLARLPLLRSERFPIKYLVPFAGFAAALAVAGARRVVRKPAVALLALLLFLLAGVGMMRIASFPEFLEYLVHDGLHLAGRERFVGLDSAGLAGALVAIIERRLLHGVVASGGMLFVLLLLARRLPPERTAWLLALLVLGDLSLAAHATVATAPIPREPSRLERLASERSPEQRIWLGSTAPNSPEIAHHDGETRFSDMTRSMALRGQLPGSLVRITFEADRDGQANPRTVLVHSLLRFCRDREEVLRILGRLGAAWLGEGAPDELPGGLSYPIPAETPEYVYPNPYPRPYVAAQLRWERIDPTAVGPRVLVEALGSAARWDSAILLAPADPDARAALDAVGTSTGCATASTAAARVLGPVRDDEVNVEARSVCRALVVLEEYRMPRWQVEVDGRPTPLLEADGGFMAALVPPGVHRVRFAYHGLTRPSAAVGLAALVFALGLLMLGKRPLRTT